MEQRYSLLIAAGAALAAAAGVQAADICNPNDLHGSYGFQLSGTSRIAGPEKPIAAIGRMVFGDGGSISGVSSVNFNGLFLGNPVTGKYEAKSDCSATWSLQDDSGGWQHFAGKMMPGGARVEFHQADGGIAERGILSRAPDRCDATTFQGTYDFRIAGMATPFASDVPPSLVVSAAAEANGNGGLTLVKGTVRSNGSYSVDTDCVIQMELAIPDGGAALLKLRGILVNGGKEVLAVATDPDRVATARFAAIATPVQ